MLLTPILAILWTLLLLFSLSLKIMKNVCWKMHGEWNLILWNQMKEKSGVLLIELCDSGYMAKHAEK